MNKYKLTEEELDIENQLEKYQSISEEENNRIKDIIKNAKKIKLLV